MLQTKYHFDDVTAGYMFGIPFIISAISSPFLGIMIDKIGKRALLITLGSVILLAAYSTSMFMPECDQCYNEVYPLVLIGIGYSIYAAAIWGSVPYVVESSATGTAFGIATAVQNIGLVIAPTLVGAIKDSTRSIDHGFFYTNAFFLSINLIGLILNICLYYIDINHNESALDKVYGSSASENPTHELQTSINEQFTGILSSS